MLRNSQLFRRRKRTYELMHILKSRPVSHILSRVVILQQKLHAQCLNGAQQKWEKPALRWEFNNERFQQETKHNRISDKFTCSQNLIERSRSATRSIIWQSGSGVEAILDELPTVAFRILHKSIDGGAPFCSRPAHVWLLHHGLEQPQSKPARSSGYQRVKTWSRSHLHGKPSTPTSNNQSSKVKTCRDKEIINVDILIEEHKNKANYM